MKDKADLVRGWLRKAASDLVAMDAAAKAGALDAACFHAQQSAEKHLKAFLTQHEVAYPHSHNLGRLVRLCAVVDPAFGECFDLADELTPYAVEVRYDSEFWPVPGDVASASGAAKQIQRAVLARLNLPDRPA